MKTPVLKIAFVLTLFLTSCNSKDYGKWSEQEIETAKKAALFSAEADPDLKTDVQRQKFVDCYVEKLIMTQPDPMKQAEIPMDKLIEMGEDCRAQALK